MLVLIGGKMAFWVMLANRVIRMSCSFFFFFVSLLVTSDLNRPISVPSVL